MAHVKDWMSLSEHNAEWEQVVKDQMDGKPPDVGAFTSIESMRDWLREEKKAMTAAAPKVSGVVEHDEQVSMRDGHIITCRIIKPEKQPGHDSPLAVIFHGGGWCIGGLENEELLCKNLASKLGCCCVNVDYRLAPDWKFPYAVHDTYDAIIWAAENASSFGANPSKGFIIGGTSSGANLAAVVAHLLRDENFTPKLTGCLFMIAPWCYHRFIPQKYQADHNSWEQNKDAPVLTRKGLNLFFDNYIPEEEDRKDKRFSPLLWEDALKGLPPCYFQVCGNDPLRDDSLIAERVMREEHGIKTKLEVYPGLPHSFWTMAPGMEVSRKFVGDSVEGVGWLLEQK